MGVKKVLDELLVQYLFYGYSVHISILSFQRENCKRMHPSGVQIITWQAVVLSLCLRGCWEDERGDAPDILLADNLSDRLYETGAGEVFTVRPAAAILAAAAQRIAKTVQLTAPPKTETQMGDRSSLSCRVC